MSESRGTEDVVSKTISCATAKILGEMDAGATKQELRLVILRELNGIRRFITKLIRNQAERPIPPEED